MITPPYDRLDLGIKEDLIEEVGRIYGYEHVPREELPPLTKDRPINSAFYYKTRIRLFMQKLGFFEVYTYNLGTEGDLAVQSPIASDKEYLRTSITPALEVALEKNERYCDLLALSDIRIFEVSSVFPQDGEHLSFGVGIRRKGGKKPAQAEKDLVEVIRLLSRDIDVDLEEYGVYSGAVFEVNLSHVIENAPEPKEYQIDEYPPLPLCSFAPLSPYPYVLRDIAVWVPEGVSVKEVEEIIKEHSGTLLTKIYLFDEYQKDGRVSYAFRLVFQSHEKTLSDDEVNVVVKKVYSELNGREGWETR